MKGLIKLGKGEEYVGGVANSDETSQLYYFHVRDLQLVNKIDLSMPIKQLSMAKSYHSAAILTETGVVQTMDLMVI